MHGSMNVNFNDPNQSASDKCNEDGNFSTDTLHCIPSVQVVQYQIL